MSRVSPGRVSVTSPFEMDATFDSASGTCSCCQYRQYVQGRFRRNGRQVTHLMASPDGGPPRRMLPRPRTGGDGNFREDGIVSPRAGVNVFYGHRDEGTTDPTDRYLPHRNDGCTYHGTDAPGWRDVPETDFVETDLDFLGRIIDVCDGDKVVGEARWSVSCSNIL